MGRTLVLAAAARRRVVDGTPRATAHVEARRFVVFFCYLLLFFAVVCRNGQSRLPASTAQGLQERR